MNKFSDFNADLKNHSLLNPKLYRVDVSSLFASVNEFCLFCGGVASDKDKNGREFYRILEIEDRDFELGVSEIRMVPVCEDCSVVCSKIIEIQQKRDETR
jgi:hypothetical protein